MAVRRFMTASINAERLNLAVTFRSAPRPASSVTTAVCPQSDARITAVCPCSSLELISASWSSSRRIWDRSPWRMAAFQFTFTSLLSWVFARSQVSSLRVWIASEHPLFSASSIGVVKSSTLVFAVGSAPWESSNSIAFGSLPAAAL